MRIRGLKMTIQLGAILSFYTMLGQTPVDVTDQTIKIPPQGEESLFFGFAAGDRLIFNFQEANGKELREVEIIEYPSNTKFSDYKTDRIQNKTVQVEREGVYQFRFLNSHLLRSRICKIRIQRIPESAATAKFNTTVSWVTKQDTVWNTYTQDVIVRYDTTYEIQPERTLVSETLHEEMVLNKSQRVHSLASGNNTRTALTFSLPRNHNNSHTTKQVVSWAYWVGVGQEANDAWKQNSSKVAEVAQGAATYFTTPLGALAIGLVVELAIPKIGEDVYYAVAPMEAKRPFLNGQSYRYWDEGKGIAGYRRFTDQSMCSGSFCVLLANDNYLQGVDVTIKVIAIMEVKVYEDRNRRVPRVSPVFEKKIFKDPVISSSMVPMLIR